jgi:isocitrate dehydrogenase
MNDLSIDELDEEIEKDDKKITLSEKKEILKTYENKYGSGFKKFLDKTFTGKGGEKKDDGGGSGVDWNAIKFKL